LKALAKIFTKKQKHDSNLSNLISLKFAETIRPDAATAVWEQKEECC
jgi:hypothetical protein